MRWNIPDAPEPALALPESAVAALSNKVADVVLPDDVYARLLKFRTRLRQFERWSADQAQAAGLTPAQHQLLLAIRGHDDPRGPTVGEAAEYLLLRHHSAGELIQRAEAAGLVDRVRDIDDQRVIRLRLTDSAARCLQSLSALHIAELERFGTESFFDV